MSWYEKKLPRRLDAGKRIEKVWKFVFKIAEEPCKYDWRDIDKTARPGND